MKRYDYDTKSWIQRSPFMFTSLGYMLVLVLVLRQQHTSRTILHLKYGRNYLVMYCVAITCTVLCRMLYFFSGPDAIPTPSALFGVVSFLPSLLMIATCVFFLNYLLNSLQSRFGTVQGRRYIVFELITQTFLAVLFPLQLAFFCFAIYQKHYDGFLDFAKWTPIYHNVNNGAYLIVAFFLVYIIKCYNEKLKLVPIAFQERRKAIVLVIVATFVQVVAKIANALLIVIKVYDKLEEITHKENKPYAQLCYAVYHTLGDILPLLAYTYYIEKDTENLAVFEMTEDGYQGSPMRTNKESFTGYENPYEGS
eukprot:TRINITY_DN9491_c0_g1_i2.p1 TRINITY_DN9491_c0_g1~~TRINITY_DN9491_c0_g1_i2.p1  ORF type:complete len:335 (-),score=73.53 TRINITY_DN9491_c0_g1_i2:153-1079(-)